MPDPVPLTAALAGGQLKSSMVSVLPLVGPLAGQTLLFAGNTTNLGPALNAGTHVIVGRQVISGWTNAAPTAVPSTMVVGAGSVWVEFTAPAAQFTPNTYPRLGGNKRPPYRYVSTTKIQVLLPKSVVGVFGVDFVTNGVPTATTNFTVTAT